MTKSRHKQQRAQLKKQRRARKRQIEAQNKEIDVQVSESESHESGNEDEKRERSERLHLEWIRRETEAQEEFQRRKVKEEQIKREKEEKERRLREEWEELQRKEKEEKERIENQTKEKKEREAALLKEATQHLTKSDGVWNNPTVPENYGSEQDKQNCPFFLKTGVCRFGDRCSRIHVRPSITNTLLIPGMFNHFSLDKTMRDEYDSDMGLEYEDNECCVHFREFYDDVLPEFKRAGRVVQFKVCRNHSLHLRGNVYIQFEKEEEALEAFKMFNGRYYAGKQLSCEFTSIAKWKSAICGLYHKNRCPKGKLCNFLHVFINPNNEFFDADRGVMPSWRTSDNRRSISHRTWHRGSRAHSYRRSRSPRRSRSRSSRRSRSKSSRRSRSRSSRRSRSKSPRRSRSRSSRRSRSKSPRRFSRRSRSKSPSRSSKRSKRRSRSRSESLSRRSSSRSRSRSESIRRSRDSKSKRRSYSRESRGGRSRSRDRRSRSKRSRSQSRIGRDLDSDEQSRKKSYKKSKKKHHSHSKQKKVDTKDETDENANR